jgi:zinc protease
MGQGRNALMNVPAQKALLPNGLTVVVQERRDLDTVALAGRFKAGSLLDDPARPGVADFVANLLLKGTASRTWEEIAEAIDFRGASLNIWGGEETVGLSGHCVSRHLDTLLELLADALRRPTFPPEEVEKHRRQVFTWLRTWDDEPDRVAYKELRRLIYPPHHPFHRRMQGEREEVESLTREDLVAFHARVYRPDGLILALVGNVETSAVLESVERFFGDWSRAGEPVSLDLPPVPRVDRAERTVVNFPDKSQAEVRLGHRGIERRHPDFYAVDVMNRVLGGSAGIGRLFNRVRDIEGLAYGVWSHFQAMWNAGPFIAGAGVAGPNVDRALASIEREIRRLREDEPPTSLEVEDVIAQVTGSFALSIETPGGLANVLVDAEFYGLGLDYPQRHGDLYRAVTRDQVVAAAQIHLQPDSLATVVAGPYPAG